MVRKSEKVKPLSIKNIRPLFNHIFNNDDIKRISESVSETGYPPIIGRHDKGSKYQLCSNPEIFEALKLLGKDTIDVIVRDITEQHGKELTLASLFSHPEISSKEREFLVWTIYNSGKYKSKTEFAKIIGTTDKFVIDNFNGKEQRDKHFGPDVTSDYISTETFRLIRPLPDDEQKLFCDRIEDGKIGGGEVRDCYKFLKDDSLSDEIKQAILNGEVLWRDAKKILESRQPAIKELEKAISLYHKKETYQDIIEKEQTNFSSEPYRLLASFTNTICLKSVENIENKNEIEQVKRYLKISGMQIFQLLYELKVIDKKAPSGQIDNI